MGKSRGSMRARRQARKRAATALPELAQVPRKGKDGRQVRSSAERDPARQALEARCRQMGEPVTRASLREARAPWRGCNAGRAMAEAVAADERAELWDAICHMRRVQLAHDLAIGAPRRHAQCLRLMLPVEALEADAAAPPPDTRSPEERLRSATQALMAVEGWLGWTDAAAAGECRRVVLDDVECRSPAALLRALRCVADGISGRRMVYRGA